MKTFEILMQDGSKSTISSTCPMLAIMSVDHTQVKDIKEEDYEQV